MEWECYTRCLTPTAHKVLMKKILFGIILAAAPLAFAQSESTTGTSTAKEQIDEHSFMLTPFIGYAFGGEIEINDTQLTEGFKSVKMSPNDSIGLRFAMRSRRWPKWQLELSFGQEKTQFEDKAKLFAESPAGEFEPKSLETLDVRVSHAHATAVWNLRTTTPRTRKDGLTQPFLLGGVGITQFSATAPVPKDTVPSFVVGGGTRIWLTQNTALRFDARGYLMGTRTSKSNTVPITNIDCEGTCLRTYRYPSLSAQIEVNLGFTWGYKSLPYLDTMVERKK